MGAYVLNFADMLCTAGSILSLKIMLCELVYEI